MSKFDRYPISVPLFLYGYAVLLSGAYLYAYWTPIGFDPFPYLTVQQVLTAPLSSLITVFAPFLIMLAVIPFDKSDLPKDKKYLWSIVAAHLLFYLGGIIQSLYLTNTNTTRGAEDSLLAITGILAMGSLGVMRRFMREPEQLFFPLLAVAFAQLAVALTYGHLAGKKILSANTIVTYQIRTLTPRTEVCGESPAHGWTYYQTLGDHTFYVDRSSKSICISDSQNVVLDQNTFKPHSKSAP
ncbi:hypothetical protein [Thermomonas sp.]|uniref:hypothetical protein n=1 Tax=Thermomonas sp. TaxID=1971895 RepID=UPI00391CCBE4